MTFSWVWRLRSAPARLWPLVSDTNRFNRDAGAPALQQAGPGVPEAGPGAPEAGESLRLSLRIGIWALRWREEPFEWVSPQRFAVTRRYFNGPFREMRVTVRLEALPAGGTRLIYRIDLRPRHFLFRPALALVFGILVRRRFAALFGKYDESALRDAAVPALPPERTFAPGGKARLAARHGDLLEMGARPALADRLRLLLMESDDRDLSRLRPYALADAWGENRRDVLETFLLSARAGLLDFRWDILCPSCRGPKTAGPRLRDVRAAVHCGTCRIDFKAGFDRTVEVSFRPNASIRPSGTAEYCVGGPQVTPHIRFRQSVAPGADGRFDLRLEEGWYRLRSPALPGFLHVLAAPDGAAEARLEPGPEGWPREAARWRPNLRVSLANPGAEERAYILERTAWHDDAVTAAEVTALQTFRDLFAEEALRPGEEISVGSLTFLFTDLKGSTRLYREVGDAKAFALVMGHFDLLKSAIAAEGGAIVKTIGDAVMAVFPNPPSALRAALQAHRSVEASLRPLVLKAGVHTGPCIAVNQNERLDYFGSTLNLSARLLGFCTGGDVVMTREVAEDPETARWLSEHAADRSLEDLRVSIRGFEKETFALKRILPEEGKRAERAGARAGQDSNGP